MPKAKAPRHERVLCTCPDCAYVFHTRLAIAVCRACQTKFLVDRPTTTTPAA